MSKKTLLNTFLIMLLVSSSTLASVKYRATGQATSDDFEGIPFSLDYLVDENQTAFVDQSDGRAAWIVESFDGFIGSSIAISGSGANLNFGGGFFDFSFGGPDDLLTLSGDASFLVNTDFGFTFAIPQSTIDKALTGEFPIQEATYDGSDQANTGWSFSASDPLSESNIFISGFVDEVRLLEGPDDMSDGGNNGGGDGMMGGNGGGGGGAVPEPASAVVWLTLLGGIGIYGRWRQKAGLSS